jgi:o-succinylbenzoate synthase
LKARFSKYILNFKQPGGTSRGVLHSKVTYFLKLSDGEKWGIGECALFKGLSADDRPDYEEKLNWLCQNINLDNEVLFQELIEFPSIQFGLEQAFLSFKSENPFVIFPSEFTQSKKAIPINGLIWMGTVQFMKQQISEKLKSGFTTLKLKIGALDFNAELDLLNEIRKSFSPTDVEIRVDANGAFHPSNVLEKLNKLSKFNIHSIEQPIKQNQIEDMASICSKSPIPVALDEELIGIFNLEDKQRLLQSIAPQYIILKPSLVGGFKGSEEWINLAQSNKIGWWITSALESNVGLNAIAQWTYNLNNQMPQGLGTGGLFTNNFESPLQVKNGRLFYKKNQEFKFNLEI